MERLKLCLAPPHFYPTYGGAQMRYLRYLPGLRARGIDTWVATGTPLLEERTETDRDRDWYKRPVGEALPPVHVEGALVRRVRLPDVKGRWRSRVFYRSVVALCREPELRPDAVQFISNLRARALPWLRELRQMGIPTLYSVSQFPSWPSKPRKRFYRGWVYKNLYNHLDAIVTNSDPLRDFLRDIGVTTRIEMIPNGVDCERFHPVVGPSDERERRARRQAFGIAEADPVVAIVGAVTPRKGHDLLLEAWVDLAKRFPSLQLLVVGPRADQHDPKLSEFGHRLEALVAASGAVDRVHFAGMTPDVEAVLRTADVFVLPSQREGFPNSVLEAMATGLPVVVTPFVGFSERIGRAGQHYLLADRSPAAVADALARLLEHPTLRNALGAAGRRWVTETLGVEASLDRYAAFYRDVVAARGR